MRTHPRMLIAAGLALLIGGFAPLAAGAEGHHRAEQTEWTGTWYTAPTLPFTDGSVSDVGFADQTIRQPLHTSVGGEQLRLRVSNVFGEQPLTIDAVTLAEPRGAGGIDPDTSTPVTFDGAVEVTIPAGAEVWSDPVVLTVAADTDVTASLYVSEATGPTTWHRLAASTTYVSGAGDHTADATADAFTTTVESFFFVTGLEVAAPAGTPSVVTFGDSLTDGVGSTVDGSVRYPDVLARRLGGEVGVLNSGIGANQVINDTEYGSVGALGRFDRDALDQPGVTDIILIEGVNDILSAAYFPDEAPTAEEMIAAYTDLVDAAHARGLTILGSTLAPMGGAEEYTEDGEAIRQTVNEWILEESTFDGLLDVAALWGDPDDPTLLDPAYDSGDGLHPNDAGYRALAEAIDLDCLSLGEPTTAAEPRRDCMR